MDIVELLKKAESQGITVAALNGNIVLRYENDSLSEELRAELKRNKDSIIAHLSALVLPHAPDLIRQPRPQLLPVSFAQERLWLLEQLQVVGTAYNVPAGLRIRGFVNTEALKKSIAELVRRHEVLRTRFEYVAGQPTQTIDPARETYLEQIDLSGLAPRARELELAAQLRKQIEERFDLESGPLFKAVLLQLAASEHTLLITMHHIVTDGWSTSILIRELKVLYAAFSNGLPSPLAELEIQYADYTIWQRAWLQGNVLDQHLVYWRKKLSDLPAALELPTDRPRPVVASFMGGRVAASLSIDLSTSLTELGRKEGSTLFMVLLSAYQIFLARLTGQKDIVVGSPVAGRPNKASEDLIGFFVNTVILRSQIYSGLGFRDILREVKDVTLNAYAHQEVPFERLVAELQPERNLSRQPLYQVAMTFHTPPLEAMETHAPTFQVTNLSYEHTTAKSDLMLFVFEDSRGIRLVFEYATDLFDEATIAHWMRCFETLLQAIVIDPDRLVISLPLLSEADRTGQLLQWNGHRAEDSKARCIHELIANQARLSPNAAALIDDGWVVSFSDLDRRSTHLGLLLRQLGVVPEVVVGMCIRRSAQAVIALLGILKAGGVYLPLDEQLPPSRLAHLIHEADVSILVSESALSNLLPVHPKIIYVDDEDEHLRVAVEMSQGFPNTTHLDNAAYVLFTSGSTGKPNPVAVSHRAILNVIEAHRTTFGITSDDRISQCARLSFDVSIQEILVSLNSGATLCISSGSLVGPELVEFLDGHRITTAMLPSAVLPYLPQNGLPCLRRLFVGGERFDSKLAAIWAERGQFINEYGTTETAVCSTFDEYKLRNDPVCIGRPIGNTWVYVLDEELEPVPVGVTGELYIGGAGVGRGYWKRAGMTAERFLADAYGPAGSRMYRTGDRVRYRRDGNLEFIGRSDYQVKVRGYRIELGEIETVLLQAPGVKQAVVVAQQQDDQQRLVAYVAADVEALKAESEEKFEGVKEETVGQWERLFSDNYEGASVEGPTFVGWNSSYTGEPIIEEQMQEWLECTVQRIRKLAPHEVLEIGCGVGLLVQALAPDCSRYRGVDFSLTAIEELRRWIEGREDLRNVELAMCEARHLDTIAGRYDTVLLNSVIQYFPDVQYLEEVLRKAVQKVEPGGQVYIGDVRHLGLLHAFHTSVQLSKGSEGLSVSTLRGRIERAVSQDKELVVDPALFRQMGTEWGVSVAMELKGGWANNELNCYRYEVVLVVPGGDKEDSQSAPPMIAWSEGSSMGELTQRLEQAMPSGLRITGIPNCRVSRDLTAWALIERSSPSRSVEDLIRELQEIDPGGEEPEEFRRLAEQFGYTAQVHLSEEGPQQFEVEFFPSLIASRSATRRTEADFEPQRSPQARAFRQLPPESLTPYANDPTRSSLLQRLTTALRERLRDALPDYMVPSAVVALDEMPLTQNGKVDRNALLPPEFNLETDYIPPRTQKEAILCDLFAEVLGLKQVGIDANFFELGGDSITSIRMVRQARQLNLVIRPRDVFQHRSIASLAHVALSVQDQTSESEDDPEGSVPLTPRMQAMQEFREPIEHFNSIITLRVSPDLNYEHLIQALQAVIDHHDILRLQLGIDDKGAWSLKVRSRGAVQALLYVRQYDFQGSTGESLKEAVTEYTAMVKRLDPRAGVMLQALWAPSPEKKPGELVLAINHLAIDGISSSILVSDLKSACHAVAQGHLPEFGKKGTSFRAWARCLVAEAHSDHRGKELPYWKRVVAPGSELITGVQLKEQTTSNQGKLTTSLSSHVTNELFRSKAKELDTDVSYLFLTSLTIAISLFRARNGDADRHSVLVDIDSHGRQEIFPNIELSRTIGWFSDLYPVRFDLRDIDIPDAVSGGISFRTVSRRVTEELRAVPDGGLGYALLRYLNKDTAAVLANMAKAQVGFNYVGRLRGPKAQMGVISEEDPGIFGDRAFRHALEAQPKHERPLEHCLHLEVVVGEAKEGLHLRATWTWARAFISADDIRQISQDWADALNHVVSAKSSSIAR